MALTQTSQKLEMVHRLDLYPNPVLLWSCLGQRWQCLNTKHVNNPGERLASDAHSQNARNTKCGSLNCTQKNRVSDVRAAFTYKQRAAGARSPKQGLYFFFRRTGPISDALCSNEQRERKKISELAGPLGCSPTGHVGWTHVKTHGL